MRLPSYSIANFSSNPRSYRTTAPSSQCTAVELCHNGDFVLCCASAAPVLGTKLLFFLFLLLQVCDMYYNMCYALPTCAGCRPAAAPPDAAPAAARAAALLATPISPAQVRLDTTAQRIFGNPASPGVSLNCCNDHSSLHGSLGCFVHRTRNSSSMHTASILMVTAMRCPGARCLLRTAAAPAGAARCSSRHHTAPYGAQRGLHAWQCWPQQHGAVSRVKVRAGARHTARCDEFTHQHAAGINKRQVAAFAADETQQVLQPCLSLGCSLCFSAKHAPC
jgi:hypothetical protein